MAFRDFARWGRSQFLVFASMPPGVKGKIGLGASGWPLLVKREFQLPSSPTSSFRVKDYGVLW